MPVQEVDTFSAAVVTDSVSCLTPEMILRYKIVVLPLNLLFGGQVYRDGVDMTPTQAYELFQKDPSSFATSAPSPGDCLEAFRKASQVAPNIICVTVSSQISMVYNSCHLAKEQAKTELPGVNIAIIDSRTATAAEGFIALEAARAAEQGKSFVEVTAHAKAVRDRVQAVVMLDTVRHVYRSGRIPKVASQVGSMLDLKPVFTLSGTVHFAGVVRSREKGIERAFNIMRENVGNKPVHCAVMHAYAPEEAVKLKEELVKQFDCREAWLTEFSPLMGYATGTGTLGIAYFAE